MPLKNTLDLKKNKKEQSLQIQFMAKGYLLPFTILGTF